MKLEFKKVHFNNFLSFNDAEVNLNVPGYTLITGINENPDDNASSNGAGKTTILEAVHWAITGLTIRGAKDVVNHNGDDGAYVELEFSVDGTNYKLLRSKDHSKYKTTLKIYINGEDKSGKGIRDTEKLLEEYLPELNSSLISSVVILGQGLPQRFTNNTPSGRKEVLETLSKSDFMISDLKTRIAQRKSELNSLQRVKEDRILELNSTIELYKSQIEKNKELLESLGKESNFDDSISKLEESIRDCENSMNNLESDMNDTTSMIQKTKDEELSTISSFNEKIKEINEKWNPILEASRSESSNAMTLLLSKQSELHKIQNIKDICPTCGQKIPNVFKPDTTELEEEIAILKQKSNDAAQIDTENKENSAKQLQEVQNEIDEKVKKFDEFILVLQKSLDASKENFNSWKLHKEEYQRGLEKLKLDKESYNSRKQVAESVVKNNEEEIEKLTNEILYNNTERDNILERIEIINKFNTIITRDFRGYLLKNVINFIDKKSKEYSLELFGTDKLDFCQDGNNISISYDNKEYECLSGGEKQKVDLIVQFAIRDMLCKYLNFSSNILALDELTDNLDAYGAEKLFNLISKKLNDVESIFIISHHSDFSLPVDNEIVVRKGTNSISYIQ